MKQEDLDKLFRDTFTDVEKTPNHNIWDKIETQLNESEKIIPLPKTRNLWTIYASAAIILCVFGLSWMFFNNSPKESERLEQKVIAYNEPEKVDRKVIENNNMTLNQNLTPFNEVTVSNTITNLTTPKPEDIQISPRQKTELTVSVKEKTFLVKAPNHLELAEIQPPIVQVTEIEDIKPLIEDEEEMESMYAATTPSEPKRGTLVTNMLNKLTENIEVVDSKNLHFSADEEGSIRLDIINSFVKNRIKKRR